MGLIDVHAAFQLLSQTHTPVDPNNVPWDLHISGATDPSVNGITCESSFATTIEFENRGDNTITEVLFEYNINGGTNQTATWTGTLSAGQSTAFELPAISTTEFGDLGLNIAASIVGQPTEYEHYNNRWRLNFNRRELTSLPFTEGFEEGLELNDWLVKNDDGNTTWDTIATGGLQWSSKSATVQLYSYNPRQNQRDGLISPLLEIPTSTEPVWLIFDLAYQMRSTSLSIRDTLQILASTDCGANFDQMIFDKSGEELSTSDTTESNFMPLFEWDWRTDSVDLSAFAGEELMLQFQTINRKGNNVYLDNIRVFTGNQEPASIEDYGRFVSVYPNPTSSELFVELSGELERVDDLEVQNVLGQPVGVASAVSSNRMVVDTEALESGVYFLRLVVNGNQVVKRFIKQ
jgi:hypothetical protein